MTANTAGPAATAAPVHTVGHGSRSTEELVAILRSAAVTRVIDVRRFPASRRHPHFGDDSLRKSLPDLGLAYEWWGESLGGRRRTSPQSRHPAWTNDAFRGYADHTETDVYRSAIGGLAAAAASGESVAVMCAESLWWRCHRRLIADSLTVRGTPVVHLLDARHHQTHRLHPSLRLDREGWPVYDRGAPRPLF